MAADASSNQVVKNPKVDRLSIPVTDFAPGQVIPLLSQPVGVVYNRLGELRLDSPTLGVNAEIVGAALGERGWDLTWLAGRVAYLEGSAYPTLSGNTVLTGHVTDASNRPGPFSGLQDLQEGGIVYLRVNGQVYVLSSLQIR